MCFDRRSNLDPSKIWRTGNDEVHVSGPQICFCLVNNNLSCPLQAALLFVPSSCEQQVLSATAFTYCRNAPNFSLLLILVLRSLFQPLGELQSAAGGFGSLRGVETSDYYYYYYYLTALWLAEVRVEAKQSRAAVSILTCFAHLLHVCRRSTLLLSSLVVVIHDCAYFWSKPPCRGSDRQPHDSSQTRAATLLLDLRRPGLDCVLAIDSLTQESAESFLRRPQIPLLLQTPPPACRASAQHHALHPGHPARAPHCLLSHHV